MQIRTTQRLYVMLLLSLTGSTAFAVSPKLPSATLQRLKGALVFIELKDGDNTVSSGSGFIFKRTSEAGHIITNAHVVALPGAHDRRKVNVVLHSGTEEERILPADVIAEDSIEDLAILAVEPRGLPKPLDFSKTAELKSGYPIFILGFPFGFELSANLGYPAATFAQATVTTVHRDNFSHPIAVEVEGDIHPGNSGGPMVNLDGQLVGVSVAKVRGTNVGLAIPRESVNALYRGYIGVVDTHATDKTIGETRLQVSAYYVDPLQRISDIDFTIYDADQATLNVSVERNGNWQPAGKTPLAIVTMQRFADAFVGTLRLNAATHYKKYIYQATIKRSGRPPIRDRPGDFSVRFLTKSSETELTNKARHADRLDALRKKQLKRREATRNRMREAGRPIINEMRKVNGATVTKLATPGKCAVLSDTGNAAYCLDRYGILYKITLPNCVETAQLDCLGTGTWLERSTYGLLVCVPERDTVLVVDEESLTIQHRIRGQSFCRVAASPTSQFAFAIAANVSHQYGLHALDLKSNQIIREIRISPMLQHRHHSIRIHDTDFPTTFGNPVVTPDGNYLVCKSENLTRYRIDGDTVILEEVGPRLPGMREPILGGGGAYIAVPSSAAYNRGSQISGSYIYDIENLQTPVMTVPVRARAIAFDDTAKKIYASSDTKRAVLEFDSSGVQTASYTIGGGRPIDQIHVHPNGNKMLVVATGELFWVELPESTPSSQ